MYKVFVKNRPLQLIESLENLPVDEGSLFFRNNSEETLEIAIREFRKNDTIKTMAVYHSGPEKLWKIFASGYKLIEAAGGLVRNANGEILFIFRNGKWDLPKGKLEKGEIPEDGAIREVEEECNVSGLKIINELSPTWHTYDENGKDILKKTYWYEMSCTEYSEATPQLEEGITAIRWLQPDQLSEVMANTYESLKEVIISGISGINNNQV